MSPRSPEQIEVIRAQSRERILQSAFVLMAKNGYDSTSISQIARHANLSKGLLYNYFESKEDLLKTMVEKAFLEGDQLMRSIYTQDPRKTMENLISWFFRELRERPDFWKLITSLSIQVEKFQFVQGMLSKKMNEYVDFLEGLLNQLRVPNARDEARIVAALMDGIGFQYIVVKKDYPLDELEKYLLVKYCKQDPE